ncbi:hypothetical protein EIM03_29860 [Pseudomonas aeruginosa]|uniref:DUF6629 family protein n=1 Tax=Pseudomonas aeruginosa TaxID=287 RepID=UPI000F627A18|nr:DUF6629 family protein [Pseudomonas aeruginosa]RRJ46375.1 hypothetical protein EIM03_29860 [Pseudomonas aeruginosa]
MCFSAPASFTAAAVLLGLGTVTMRRARSRRELPYAAIPLLFGVQQLLEGMLWLTFPDRGSRTFRADWCALLRKPVARQALTFPALSGASHFSCRLVRFVPGTL